MFKSGEKSHDEQFQQTGILYYICKVNDKSIFYNIFIVSIRNNNEGDQETRGGQVSL